MKKIKIKGSVKALYPSAILSLFAVFTAACVAIRSYQLMYIFEPDTGFYLLEENGSFTIPLIYAAVFSSCLMFLLFSFLSGKMPKEKAPEGKKPSLAIASLFFALSLVINGMTVFADILTKKNASAAGGFMEFLRVSKTFPNFLELIFSLFAALYFVITAVSYFTGSRSYASARILSLMPVCYLMTHLIGRFVMAISFLNHSEIFWDMIATVFLMLFFLGYARIMSGIASEGRFPLTMGTGLCGSLIALMTFCSRVVTYFFAGDAYLSVDSEINLCDLAAPLLAIVFIVLSIQETIEKKPKEIEPAEPAVKPVKRAAAPIEPAAPGETVNINMEETKNRMDEEAFRIAEQYADPNLSDKDPVEAVSDLFES